MMEWKKLLRPGFLEAEQKNINIFRSEFERGYDRVVFSAPFRNIQDKTQILPLREDDCVNTRRTHSLEVSSVGRSLGKSAGEFLLFKYPELADIAITAADIGA